MAAPNPVKRKPPEKHDANPRKRPKIARTDLPDASLPIINHAPTKILAILAFGSADAGELGLGPSATDLADNNETYKPLLIPALDPTFPSTLHAVQLDCGGMHTIALTRDNRIVTWGVNDLGALGRVTEWDGGWRDIDENGSAPDDSGDLNPLESTPYAIPVTCFLPGTTFVQVAAGDSYSLALLDTGLVYGWGTFKDPEGKYAFGWDNTGALVERQLQPALIQGLENITQIACGSNHALALDTNGDIWAWGRGEKNQLGRKRFGRRCVDNLTPQRIGIKNVKFIASGDEHSLAIDKDNNVWAWGQNRFGQAGYAKGAGTDTVLSPYPMKVSGLSGKGVVYVAGGAHHSAALTANGECLTWGRIDSGQLGIAFTSEQLQDANLVRHDERNKPRICLKPTLVPNLPVVSHVACGTDHTIFIAEGRAYSTGFNSGGQLGLGHDDDKMTPQRIKAKSVAHRTLEWAGAGGNFSMVGAPV